MLNFENSNKLYDFLNQITLMRKIIPFSYKGKEYNYSLVSDLKVSTFDTNNLTSINRKSYILARTFKLLFSPNIASIEVQCVSTSFSQLHLVLNYIDNGKVKTLDYGANLIMDKDDYYSLFQVKILNTFTKSDAYKLNQLLKSDNFKLNNFLFLTPEEIDEYIRKEQSLKHLESKYDSNGINTNSCFLFEDSLFALKQDIDISKAEVLIEIEAFTSNNRGACKHIYALDDHGKYVYINGNMRYIFSLISDQIPQESLRKILLSYDDRYGLCHNNSILLASTLTSLGISQIFVVAGKRKINNVDYLYHSWLEIGDLVYDFNDNLIMKTDDYYEIYQAKVLAKTAFEKIMETKLMCDELNIFKNTPSFVNFFCDEFSRDLKKNKFLFKH